MQWRTTFRIGALLFLLGAAFNVAMFVTGAYPTALYFLLMGVGLCAMLLGLWARRSWIVRDRPPGPIKRHLLFVLGLVAAVSFVALRNLVDVDYYIEREMTWERVESDKPHHVVLRFADYPSYFVGVYSADIEDYLTRLETSVVPATFRVTSNFGSVRSQNLVHLGGLRGLESAGAYAGVSGPYTASPWEDHRGD
jgi:hypothetical protein